MVNLDPAARPTFAVVLEALRASPSCPPSYSGKFSPVLALQPLAGASSALQQAPGVTAAAAQAAAAIDGGVAPRALPQQAGVGLELQPNHEGGLVVTGIVQGSPSATASPAISVGDVLHAIDGQVLFSALSLHTATNEVTSLHLCRKWRAWASRLPSWS
jgi:hypothetical protein